MEPKGIVAASQPQWFSVYDNPPRDDIGKIIVTDGKESYLTRSAWLYKSPNGKIRSPGNYGAGIDVTHWMPLPLPPKEV